MYMNYLIGSFYLGYYFKVEFQVSIFVGNLPFRAEREDILELFTPYGEVMNCSLPLERDTGRKRGFAFVEMADEALETSAIDGLQGTELMGRPLRINKAEPRGGGGGPRRGGGGGRGGYGGGGNGGGYGGGGNGGGYGGGGNGGGYGGGGNGGGYGGGGNGGGYGGGGGGNYSEPASSYVNKSSGAEGWEDRSYGNSSENSDFENGRSRRKRSVSSNSEISQEGN
jgi:RNA recognition motif-containing protein